MKLCSEFTMLYFNRTNADCNAYKFKSWDMKN